jgi:serine/threonine-protein kinase RsbW
METVITLSIESDMNKVPLVGQLIQHICRLHGLKDEDGAKVELALVEATNNVIEHAYQMRKGHKVEIICKLLDKKIVIDICDEGHSLDPDMLAAPQPESLLATTDELPEGGWGLQLIQAIMDEVSYSTNNGINRMSLTKNLNG